MGKTPHGTTLPEPLELQPMTDKFISAAEEWPAARPTRLAQPRPCILVVEDNDIIRQLNTELLTYSGYAVDAAADGAAAWEALYHRDYDLLVTDNNMPKLTGVELLKRVHAVGMVLPVIMATKTLPAYEFACAPWLRPAAVLLKPYAVTELLVTVQEVLRATASARLEMPPPPEWLSHRAADGLQGGVAWR